MRIFRAMDCLRVMLRWQYKVPMNDEKRGMIESIERGDEGITET